MLTQELWAMEGDKRDAVIWDALVDQSDAPRIVI